MDDDAAKYTELGEDGTGLEKESVEADSISHPFDPTRIRIESKTESLVNIISRIEHGELNLNPGFQRMAGIWSDGAQSRLMESMLIRVPLPAFYMDATNEDHWIVIDGLQRLTAVRRFVIDKELKLTDLEFLKDLHTKTFDKLPHNFQRRIRETNVTVYLIEPGTPPDVKFNIFKRINTGGMPLSPQEIRHALNQKGPATALLIELANSKEFKTATDYGVRDKRRGAEECVLRFFAFRLVTYNEDNAEDNAKDFDSFLNKAMEQINKKSEKEILALKQEFFRAMKAARCIFGPYAFRKIYGRQHTRNPINKSLFEAWSVNLASLDDRQLEILFSKKEQVTDKFICLLNNDRDFDSAISQGTGKDAKVRKRFEDIKELISEVVNAG